MTDKRAAVEMTAYARFLAATTTNDEVFTQAQEVIACGLRMALAAGIRKSEFDKLTRIRYIEILRAL